MTYALIDMTFHDYKIIYLYINLTICIIVCVVCEHISSGDKSNNEYFLLKAQWEHGIVTLSNIG